MRDYVRETRELADRSIEYSKRAYAAAKLGTMAGEEVLALAEWEASAEAMRYTPRRIECGQYEVVDNKTGERAVGTSAASYGAAWTACRDMNARARRLGK